MAEWALSAFAGWEYAVMSVRTEGQDRLGDRGLWALLGGGLAVISEDRGPGRSVEEALLAFSGQGGGAVAAGQGRSVAV